MQDKKPYPKKERQERPDGVCYRTKSDKPFELADWQKQLKCISNNFDKFQAGDHQFFEQEFAKIEGSKK